MTISRFACLLAACLGLGATAPASARSLDDILKAGELRVGVNPTLPPRACTSCMLLTVFSNSGPEGARTMTGTASSISAMGPCFISPLA